MAYHSTKEDPSRLDWKQGKESKQNKLEHIRWRAIPNPRTLEEI